MKLTNKKGIMLIWVYLLIMMISISCWSLYAVAMQQMKLMDIRKAQSQALYLAEAGVDQIFKALPSNPNPNATGPVFLNNNVPNFQYSASHANQTITSTGCVGYFNGTSCLGTKKILEVKVTGGTVPVGVHAAITSVGDVDIQGRFVADGRDYDSNGNLTGDPGISGVYTAGELNIKTNSHAAVGGNGIAPSNPANPLAYDEDKRSYTFSSPEAALGVSPGALDQYKVDRFPAPPLSGIIYYTGDDHERRERDEHNNDIIRNLDFGTEANPSSGILIVHNSTNTATLKNITGSFKGLIIADNVVKIRGDGSDDPDGEGSFSVLGGVIAQQTTTNKALGTAKGSIKYSSQVLKSLPLIGSAQREYSIVSWKET